MCVTLLILIKSLNANPAYSSVTINVDEPANHLIFSFAVSSIMLGVA